MTSDCARGSPVPGFPSRPRVHASVLLPRSARARGASLSQRHRPATLPPPHILPAAPSHSPSYRHKILTPLHVVSWHGVVAPGKGPRARPKPHRPRQQRGCQTGTGRRTMQSSQPLLRRSIWFFWEGVAHNLEMRAARRRAKTGGRETASNSLPKPWGLRRRLQVSDCKA